MAYVLAEISSFFRSDLLALQALRNTETLWQTEIDAAITLCTTTQDIHGCLAAIQNMARILKTHAAGLGASVSFKSALEAANYPTWHDVQAPPVDTAMQQALAEKLYIVRADTDIPCLELGDQTRILGPMLFDMCVSGGIDFDVHIQDENFMALLLNSSDDAGIKTLATMFVARRARMNMRILVQQNLSRWPVLETNPDKMRAYRTLLAPVRTRMASGAVRSVLTTIPTERDALIDGIPYDTYCDVYFRMCDQPWDLIKVAQAHLIEKLNAGKTLHFTNDDGTDVRMSIDGFTFCNSVIARNIPGSEVFSAPVRDSVSGVIVAKGRFSPRDQAGAILEDLELTFEAGQLIKATARIGQAELDHVLAIDAGTHYVGEIGIGTNPYLKRHVASILLSEKIGGSFHVALGDAYTMTDYMGTPVHVDNGNRSLLHWDITTMLYGKGGCMMLDDVPIMRDGLFLDPTLDVLNRGWAVLPPDKRPVHWQDVQAFV